MNPLQSTVRVVCVLDLAVLADANICWLHVGSFGKEDAWPHFKPLMGAVLPPPPLPGYAGRGPGVESGSPFVGGPVDEARQR